jgi:hypothetical protein
MTVAEALTLGSGLVVILGAIGRCFYLIGQLQARVEILLSFLYRRGEAEAASKGWGTFNSPFAINAAGVDVVLPFLDKFIPLYAKLSAKGASEAQMFIEFEREFGDFIVQKICIPNGLTQGACLVSIIKACRTAGHPERRKHPREPANA